MTTPSTASEASRIRLTAPQFRALYWLPADGAWSGRLTRDITPAVDSLAYYQSAWVETHHGPYGPRGGYMRVARLTVAGITERRFREAEARGWTAPDLSGETP